jgi:hypothetical protein
MKNSELETLLKNNLKNFDLSESFGHRAVGDKVEADTIDILKSILPKNLLEAKSKRSIDDFSLVFDGNISLFDTKTHFIQEKGGFSMPNLISVKRLKEVLESDLQTLSYVFIDYKRENGRVLIKDIHIKCIWELDWSILGIGNLGKGQLQIKNANKELVFTDIGKEEWFKILKVKVKQFYKNLIKSIEKEIKIWE